jgi:hypothetical protein
VCIGNGSQSRLWYPLMLSPTLHFSDQQAHLQAFYYTSCVIPSGKAPESIIALYLGFRCAGALFAPTSEAN